MDKYARQRGLIAQDLVADADLTIYGSGAALSYLLQCLALVGAATRHGRIRLCVDRRPVDERDLIGQFLLQLDDLGRPLGDALADRVNSIDPAVDIGDMTVAAARTIGIAVPTAAEVTGLLRESPIVVWGQVLPSSVYIGPRPLLTASAERPNLLTAALAAVCGGLLAQTALSQLGALIDGPSVLSSWLEERLWISYPGIGTLAREAQAEGAIAPALSGVLERAYADGVVERVSDGSEPLRIMVDGRPVNARVTMVVDDNAVVVTVPVSQETGPYSRATERARLSAPPSVQPLLWSPIEGPALDGDHIAGGDIPLPDRLPPLRVVLCGAGALGSWAAAVIAASRFPDVDMCLIDMDDTIEAHNLNRQVLFGDADIGLPKARRALEKLKEIDPDMRLQALQVMVEPTMLDDLTGGIRFQLSDEVLAAEVKAYQEQIDALAKTLSRATVLLSCPDNQQTRWCLNVISERLGVPLINGAVEGFMGVVHVSDPADHGRCLVCWLGESISREPERRSCTDLVGEAPVSAIVTSSAIIGAAQAATLIAQAAGLASPVKRYHALDGLKCGTLDGVKRLFSGYRAADRNPEECPAHLFVPTDSAPTP